MLSKSIVIPSKTQLKVKKLIILKERIKKNHKQRVKINKGSNKVHQNGPYQKI